MTLLSPPAANTAPLPSGFFASAPLPRRVKLSELKDGDLIRLSAPLRLTAKHPGYTSGPSVIEEYEFTVTVLPPPRGKKRNVIELRSRRYPQVVYDYKNSPGEFELAYRLPEQVRVFQCKGRNFNGFISFRQLVLRGNETWDEKALLAQDILAHAHSLGCAVIRLHGYGSADVWPVPEGVPDFESLREYVDDPYGTVTSVYAPGLDDRHLVYAGDNALIGHYRWKNHTAQFVLLNDKELRELRDDEESGAVCGNVVILSGFRIDEHGHTVRAPLGQRPAPAPAPSEPSPLSSPPPEPSHPGEHPMTATAPRPETNLRPHAEIYADIAKVSQQLQERDMPYFQTTIAPIFREYPRARTEAAAAQELLNVLNGYLNPQAALFSDTDKLFDLPEPEANAEPVSEPVSDPEPQPEADPEAELEPEPEPEAEPEPEVDDDSEAGQSEDSEDSGDQDEPETDEPETETTEAAQSPQAAQPAAPTPELTLSDEPLTTKWKKGELGDGWLSQLAATLDVGGSVLFSVVREKEGLRVVIQPQPGENKPEVSHRPLISTGSPAELDESLITDLLTYRRGQNIARQTESYLDELKALATQAAKKASTAASKSKAGSSAPKPKPTTGKLNITSNIEGVKISGFDGSGAPVTLKEGVNELKPGKYTLKVSAEGFRSQEHSVTVKLGFEEKLNVKLEEAGLL